MSDDATGLMPVPRHTTPVTVVDPAWQRMRPLLWAVLEAREAVDASLGGTDLYTHVGDLVALNAAYEAALAQAVACLGFTEGANPE